MALADLVSSPSAGLSVRVNGQAVGLLAQDRGQHVFSYDSDVAAQQFVSLTMPVRLRDYVHPPPAPHF